MNLNWIGSTSYLRSHNVVDHPYSHSKASNRAGNDGRSGHDLDLHSGVLNLLKMNGPISLHPMSLLFINTHFHI